MKTLEQLGQQVIEHNSFRRHFERTPEEMVEAIREEAQELVSAIQESLITGEVFPVVSEIGDIYVLCAQLCHDLGISPAHAMEIKFLRNGWKYTDIVMNNGYSQQEAISLSKQFYSEVIGGDRAFSHAYLDFLAEDDHEALEAERAKNFDPNLTIPARRIFP